MEEQNINNVNETNKPSENTAAAATHQMLSAPHRAALKLSGCDSRGLAESIILTRQDWNLR